MLFTTRWLTRLNKLLIILLVLGVTVLGSVLGLKIAKKFWRYVTTPRLYDATWDIKDMKSPVFTALSLDRIFRDGQTLVKPTLSSSVTISAAGHEYESFQVLVNPDQDLKGVRLEFSDLVQDKGGHTIGRDYLNWRVVEYVPTSKPYYQTKRVGLWPDPLIPSDSTDVKAKTVQPFWVTVYVAEDTPPGDYTGMITVRADNFQQQIPLNLKVYAFNLPKTSHLKTAFDFYGHLTKKHYPKLPLETEDIHNARIEMVNDQFIINMLKHRMEPVLNIDPASSKDLARVGMFQTYGLNTFAIGKKGGTFDNNWPKDDAGINALMPLYRQYGETLALNGLLSSTYIYTWDEGPIGNPLVPKIAHMIHEAHPGLKNMVCYHGFWNPKKEPAWGADLDIWTFQLDSFDESQMRELEKAGKEIWMYVSGPSDKKSPNLVLDIDSIDYRIIPWLCFKYGIKGFLYWCVNWWPKVNPFQDAKNSDWEQNGNGLLFYPGPNGPLDSLRVEVFRDGMEDYEYLHLLSSKIKELEISHPDDPLIKEGLKVLNNAYGLIASPVRFNKDNLRLLSLRQEIARLIEVIK